MDNLVLQGASMASLKQIFKLLLTGISVHLVDTQNQDILISNIQVLMGLRNMGAEELSVASGKNRSYVGRLLRKDFPNFNPSVETLRLIALSLRVKPSILLTADLRQEFENRLKEIECKKEYCDE